MTVKEYKEMLKNLYPNMERPWITEYPVFYPGEVDDPKHGDIAICGQKRYVYLDDKWEELIAE